jgi:hypothetical protein
MHSHIESLDINGTMLFVEMVSNNYPNLIIVNRDIFDKIEMLFSVTHLKFSYLRLE